SRSRRRSPRSGTPTCSTRRPPATASTLPSRWSATARSPTSCWPSAAATPRSTSPPSTPSATSTPSARCPTPTPAATSTSPTTSIPRPAHSWFVIPQRSGGICLCSVRSSFWRSQNLCISFAATESPPFTDNVLRPPVTTKDSSRPSTIESMDRTTRKLRTHAAPSRSTIAVLLLALAALLAPPACAQDNIFTGTSTGVTSIRIAVADFKPLTADAQTDAFKQTFDATLYADLASAGIFDIVSKSLMPPGTPGTPAEVQLQSYSNAPASAAMLVFGSLGHAGGKLLVNGYLFDVKNLQYPQVLAKQYSEAPSEDSARQVAHRFADEIIYRLGGGTPGIAETKIYYVQMTGDLTSDVSKEIWQMDYDGANQRPITHLGTISMSPRVSPDNTRLAFASFGKYGSQLKMYSLLLDRYVAFPIGNGST